jgi:hypothetical protein
VLLIPESTGYAEIAGSSSEVGLYAAPAALIAYAVFGGSRILVVATASAVSAGIVGRLVSRSRSVPLDWEYLVDVGKAFEYNDPRFADQNPIYRASKLSGCGRDRDAPTVGGGSNPRSLVHREAE